VTLIFPINPELERIVQKLAVRDIPCWISASVHLVGKLGEALLPPDLLMLGHDVTFPLMLLRCLRCLVCNLLFCSCYAGRIEKYLKQVIAGRIEG
jgi:hypothetical protein